MLKHKSGKEISVVDVLSTSIDVDNDEESDWHIGANTRDVCIG